MTEDEALRKLLDLLDRVRDRSMELENEVSWSTPEPRSSLAGDDMKSMPYQLSHCAFHAMATSLDHLHCLRSSLRGSEDESQISVTIHMQAQFTLTRGGLENAARAAWLLTPRKRLERVKRRLAIQKKEYLDTGKLISTAGGEGKEWATERVEKVLAVAWGAGVPRINPETGRTENLKLPNYGDIVSEAAEALNMHAPGAKAVWQMASALSHGDMSGTLRVLDREEIGVPSEGVQMLRVTGSIEQLHYFTGVAASMLHEALQLYRDRRTRLV